MRPRLSQPTFLALAIVVTCGGIAHAQDEKAGAWLDATSPVPWHEPGGAIPAAPAVDSSPDPRCREQARPPQTEADGLVRKRGWDLVGPYQGGWDIVVVRGAAGYDGMCRPLQFQAFVLVRGRFAGTLAPAPMDSRTDGALSAVALVGPTRLVADYVRYETSDPLCCPSRTMQVTFEIDGDPPIVHPVTGRDGSPSRPSPSVPSRPSPGDDPSRPSRDASGSASALSSLEGTFWQLVRFEGGDGTVLTPDDGSKYTIDFQADGHLAARIDCNRGRGTWTSDGARLQLGPMALTRAMCPPGSLHDRIVRHWDAVSSYVVRDGHLFLVLKADGGTYEFAPASEAK